MGTALKELLGIRNRKFYSFTTACLSLLDESNRINTILGKKNLQVKSPEEADFIVVTTCAVSKDSAKNSASNVIRLNEISGSKQIYVGGCLSNAKEKEILAGYKNIKFFTADEIFAEVGRVSSACEKTTTRCNPFWLEEMEKKKEKLEALQNKNRKLAELYAFTTDGIIFSAMPFDFDTIRISKGCSKACSYCAIPHNRGKYMEHSLDYIKKQIKTSKYGNILLIGENIGCHTDFKKIMKCAIDNRKKLMLRYLEPEYIGRIKPEYLKHIKYIGVPVQSGSVKILKEMRRPCNLEDVRQKFREWHKYGIFLGTSIILSYPAENIIDYLKTMLFIIAVPVDYVSFQNFSPRENSPAFEKYKNWDSNKAGIKLKFRLFNLIVKIKGFWHYQKTKAMYFFN